LKHDRPVGREIFQVSETWKVCPYLWRGRRYDAADGLYVRGGRRYEPRNGRGLQQ